MSLFSYHSQNTDFWLIWTEITPLLLFTSMALTSPYCSQHYDIALMYTGAIICRACSLIFHIFKSDTLLHIDMMGISANAWAVPYLMRITFGKNEPLFLACVAAIYLFINASCIYAAIQKIKWPPQQFPIVLLAIIGSYPSIYNCFFLQTSSNSSQLLIASGSSIIAFGYLVFFIGRFPESIFIEIRQASWYISHSLWHISSATGQLCFLLIPFTFI